MTTEECIMSAEDREGVCSVIVGSVDMGGPVLEESERVKAGRVLVSRRCVPLSHQVAGHKYGIDKVGILQHPDGTVLKQLQPPPRGPREMNFYTQVYAQDCTDPHLLALREHLPKYYGTWASSESPNDLYLKLEDVTHRFTRPCIMDVKIGRRSYDPFATWEKREEQIRKYPPMEEIGFLLLGMRVYQVASESYISYDQFYGRSLGKETLKSGLSRFFHNGEELRKDAVSHCICKIRSVLRWFESQRRLHFYASSLLVVYEGQWSEKRKEEPKMWENDSSPHLGDLPRRENGVCHRTLHPLPDRGTRDDEEVKGKSSQGGKFSGRPDGEVEADVEVRMIDFAHVFPSDGSDEGYTYGLRNLLAILEQILQD